MAKSLAEVSGRPLLDVKVGDIGLDLSVSRKLVSLEKMFRLAETWGAILLMYVWPFNFYELCFRECLLTWEGLVWISCYEFEAPLNSNLETTML